MMAIGCAVGALGAVLGLLIWYFVIVPVLP